MAVPLNRAVVRDINARAFKVSLVWGVISSLVVLILVKAGAGSPVIFALKDAPIYLLMFFMLPRWAGKGGGGRVAVLLAVFCFFLLSNYLLLNPDYDRPLANVRQIVAPAALLLFFCSLRLPAGAIASVRRLMFLLLIAVFLFGVIELALGLWERVGLGSYFSLKGIPVDGNGLSFMFYEPILNYQKRMTSVFLDPISLGHFFASVLLFYYYARQWVGRSERNVAVAVSAIGLILCFSKGAMLQVFVGLFLLNPRVHVLIKAVATLVPFLVLELITDKAGIFIHLHGFEAAVNTISLFGHGIGSSGNYAKMFGSDLSTYEELGISDTYIGAMIGQIGLLGLAAWLALLVSAIVPIKRSNLAPGIILLSIVAVSMISENAMNVTSFMMPAILIAMAKNLGVTRDAK